MKKQGILILGMLLALALLGAGAWFLRQPAEDPAATAEAGSEEVILFDLKAEEEAGILTRIWVDNPEGGYSATRTEEGWRLDSLEGIPLDDSLLHSLVSSVTSLKSVRKIENGGQRPEEFGLTKEKAAAVVAVGFGSHDNDRREILVGDEVPGSDTPCRYVGMDGSVYTVYQTKVGAFLLSALDFVDKEISPARNSSVDSFTLESVTMEGGRTLELTLADSSQLAGMSFHTYEFRSPWKLAADTSAVESWFPSFFNVAAEEVAVLRPSEEDLRDFGLEQPWADICLAYRDTEGNARESRFSVSEPDGEGMAFAMVPGRDVIYLVNLKGLAWAETDPRDLVSRQLLSPSVLSLSSLTLEAAGETAVEIRLEQDAANNTTVARVGEMVLEDKYFRNFYYTLISQTADEILLEEQPDLSGLPVEEKITFSYADTRRSPDVITWYRETDRMLLADTGGDYLYRMSDSGLTQLREALKKLMAGEEVPARY